MNHFERRPYCRITYWTRTSEHGGIAADKDEDWTHCTVEAHGLGGCRYDFSRAQMYERDNLLAFLEIAFQSGRADKAEEIRKAIGA